MAKRGYGFTDRFPHFGLILVIAVAIAIPLTVWSINNASTNIYQQAQAPKCGANNQNPACPVGFQCIFSSGNALLGGSCALKSLNVPVNLKFNASCQANGINPSIAVLDLSWNNVRNATDYKIYGNYYYINQDKLITVTVGPYNASTNAYTLTVPLPQNTKYFYWYVRANNSIFKTIGQPSESSAIILNCK